MIIIGIFILVGVPIKQVQSDKEMLSWCKNLNFNRSLQSRPMFNHVFDHIFKYKKYQPIKTVSILFYKVYHETCDLDYFKNRERTQVRWRVFSTSQERLAFHH